MSEFLWPKWNGARFKGGAIPLDMLGEIQALGEMMVAVAKWRYLQDHPDRKRIPSGFAKGASFRLTGLGEGSVIPIIDLVPVSTSPQDMSQLEGMPVAYEEYYQQAPEYIFADVRAAERGEGAGFGLPDECLRYFDRLGRRLREGESIEFPSISGVDPAQLTRDSRRRLIRASKIEGFTEEVLVRGSIPEMDQAKMTFQVEPIMPPGGGRIKVALEDLHYDVLLSVFNGYKVNERVLVKGIGKYDRRERLTKLESIEEISTPHPLDVPIRLHELKSLSQGWLDGGGEAPDPNVLDQISQWFVDRYPDHLHLPYTYPTPEGGVQFEWEIGPHRSSLEIERGGITAEWHDINLDTDESATEKLRLDAPEDWQWLAGALGRLEPGAE